jgi:hypothetical protein
MQLRVPELQNRQFKLETFLDGRNFAAWNHGQDVLFRARMAVSVFAVLRGLLIFYATREMFGTSAGFIALILFVFDQSTAHNVHRQCQRVNGSHSDANQHSKGL